MNRKPEIQGSVRKQIDEILAKSGNLFQLGDIQASLDLALTAWELIPEPKYQWDYYPQSLSVGFVEDYTELSDPNAVKHWIPIVYQAYGDPDRKNLYVLMLEGGALFKLGLKDEAYLVFERAFQLYGRDGFKGEHLEYLEFYLKERARRDG